MSARRYAFTPTRIEVDQDDLVKIEFTAEDIPHSFTVDEYRIAKRANAGQTVTFEFRADKPGTFRYYCNLAMTTAAEDAGGLVVRPKGEEAPRNPELTTERAETRSGQPVPPRPMGRAPDGPSATAAPGRPARPIHQVAPGIGRCRDEAWSRHERATGTSSRASCLGRVSPGRTCGGRSASPDGGPASCPPASSVVNVNLESA